MTNQDDDAKRLVREIANGSVTAFEQFYERYASLVLHIAQRVIRDQMEAEDVCHDIFLEVWKKADQYDPERGSVQAWLAVKARTRSLDRLRQTSRLQVDTVDQSQMDAATAADPTEERVLLRLDREALQSALNKIPPSQARAVHGMYYESQTHRELSEKMKRPLGTVKSLVRYGLGNIRKQLSQLGWLEPSGGAKKHD
ncbi:sigma-70 family RNA polymerase sigma factor [Brevibacillus humidisoli]|uniref:RNA polymerase sigma factor n=1 Tax=Brevibacillus humidisoli TaxID=2895522 RepID=UPI001E4640FD|nr:sigma-70 family RNA polymerase sigma factor [Brevibacillus humidisoli]UFJ39704.1 sigma-70 family RNA polymerase sigma factor [Brevibacillus humidisoli]